MTTDRMPYMLYRMAPIPITFPDLEGYFCHLCLYSLCRRRGVMFLLLSSRLRSRFLFVPYQIYTVFQCIFSTAFSTAFRPHFRQQVELERTVRFQQFLAHLLSCHSRQRERLHASVRLSVCWFVCLSPKRKMRFSQTLSNSEAVMVSIVDL